MTITRFSFIAQEANFTTVPHFQGFLPSQISTVFASFSTLVRYPFFWSLWPHLGIILAPFWGHLGPLGCPLGALGGSLALLGALLGTLGCSGGACGAPGRALGQLFGAPEGLLGSLGRPLGALGASLALVRVSRVVPAGVGFTNVGRRGAKRYELRKL